MSARRVAVVTGASRGIGRATAALLRERGYRVVGLSREAKDSRGERSCDVSDETSVGRAFAAILDDFGRVDVLVNCAGAAHLGGPLGVTVADWRRVLAVNLIGPYLCARAVLPGMRRRRFGRVVNVSSIAGVTRSVSASVAYVASKAGLNGLTRQLAAEFAADGITVNAVCPSQTRTEMLVESVPARRVAEIARALPMRRLAEPREVAEAVAFLASDGASYVNGACLGVDGGPR